jgi:hypothetical protein
MPIRTYPYFPKKDFKYLVKSVLKALLARIPGANRQRWLSINQILQAHPLEDSLT